MAEPTHTAPAPLTAQEAKSRRARNIAIAVTIFAFMALIYAVTIARLSGSVSGGAG